MKMMYGKHLAWEIKNGIPHLNSHQYTHIYTRVPGNNTGLFRKIKQNATKPSPILLKNKSISWVWIVLLFHNNPLWDLKKKKCIFYKHKDHVSVTFGPIPQIWCEYLLFVSTQFLP